MNQPSKEEIYAKRLDQSKVGREQIVNQALKETKADNHVDSSSKRHIHFKFTKKTSLFD